jgi:hypothetical protein
VTEFDTLLDMIRQLTGTVRIQIETLENIGKIYANHETRIKLLEMEVKRHTLQAHAHDTH